MKKSIKLLLVAAVICVLAPICFYANARPKVMELTEVPELDEMIVNETGTIVYGLSKEEKCLVFIDASTMEKEKELTFSGEPTDLLLEDEKLYIAVESEKQIIEVDVDSKEVTRTITTESNPCRIAKDGNHMYYAEDKTTASVYEYDLEMDTEKCIKYWVSGPDFAVNKEQHILYIAESGTSSSRLMYYNTSTGEDVSPSREQYWPNYYLPWNNVQFDGEYVYFAGYRFDSMDASVIEGGYGEESKMFCIKNGLVYKKDGIYDRDTHRKLGTYQTTPNLVAASDKAVFCYDKENGKIACFTKGNDIITSDNVMDAIDGKLVEVLPQTLKGEKRDDAYTSLNMKYALTDMKIVEEANTIFAISAQEKAMFFVNASTLDLEKTITFKSRPTSLCVYGDTVYVALTETNQIMAVDTAKREVKRQYRVLGAPVHMTVDSKMIYYTTEYSFYALEKATELDKLIDTYHSAMRAPVINEEKHMIYYTGCTGSVCYYDLKEQEYLGSGDYNYNYYDSKAIFDGTKVYCGRYAFDTKNPKKLITCFSDDYQEDIKVVKNGRVYTNASVYDANTFEFIDCNYFGETATMFDAYANGKMLYYTKENNVIEMVDFLNKKKVAYDSDGGNYNESMIVDHNTLLKEPKQPVKSGYTFLGWYVDEDSDVKWDFEKDTVTKDLCLVARWENKVTTPYNIQIPIKRGDTAVKITWEGASNTTRYEVYRAIGKDGDYSLIGTTTETTFTDDTAEALIEYYYKVRAILTEDGVDHKSDFSKENYRTLPLQIPEFTTLAANSYSSVLAKWTKVKDAEGYQLYRYSRADSSYVLVEETTNTEALDKNLATNTDYYYKVRAFKRVNGIREYGDYCTTTRVSLKIKPMSGLSISGPNKNTLKLNWKQAEPGVVYEIYRSTKQNGSYVYQGKTTGTSYSQGNLEYDTAYYYRVRECVVIGGKTYYGQCEYDVNGKTALRPMNALKVQAAANGTANLNYGTVSGMHGYEIYRSTSSNGKYTRIGTCKTASFVDKTVSCGQTYYYKVRGYRTIGTVKSYTLYSNTMKVTTVVTQPSKVKASKKSKTSIMISWNGVKAATGYEVYQSTSKNGSYKKIGTVKGKNLTSKNLKKGKTYYYKVRAYRQNGKTKSYSKYTNVVSVKLK